MKSPIKSLALLLTILGLISFGLITESQAGEKEVDLTHTEGIGVPGAQSTFASPLSIPKDTSLRVIADVSMEVSIEVIEVNDEGNQVGNPLLASGLTSETGVLTGTLTVSGLVAGKKYVLKETYTGKAVPKAIIPLDTYTFDLPNVLTHEFTATGLTYEIGIDAKVTTLTIKIEGDLNVEGGTFATLGDELTITLKPTIDVVADKTTLKYTSGFDATFSKNTALGAKSDPPVLTNVTIGVKTDGVFDPTATAYTNSTLGLFSFAATDENPATVVASVYLWKKREGEADLTIVGATGSELASDNFKKGDKIRLQLTVKDEGGKNSIPFFSNQIEIADSPPTKPEIAIVAKGAEGQPLTVAHDLFCEIVKESTDLDGEDVTYTYEWTKNGNPVNVVVDTIDDLAKGQTWKCTVTPKSAGVNGESVTAEGKIGNSPLTIDAIDIQAIAEGNLLDFKLPLKDLDGDDDIQQPTIINIEPTPKVQPEIVKGDSWHLKWTPGLLDASAETGFTNYTVKVEATDGEATVEGSFGVTVNNANQAVTVKLDGQTQVEPNAEFKLTIDISDDDTDNKWNVSIWSPGINTSDSLKTAVGAFVLANDGYRDSTQRTFSWTPTDADGGKNFTFSVTVKDNARPTSSTTQAKHTLAVGDANQSPTLRITRDDQNAGQTIEIKETGKLVLNVFGDDPDDGDNVTLSVDAALVKDRTAKFEVFDSGNKPKGTLTLPDTGKKLKPGSYTFVFKAEDDGTPNLSDTVTVIVDIEAVNDSPAFVTTTLADSYNEGQLIKLDVKAEDPDGDVLSITAKGLPDGAQLSPTVYDTAAKAYSRTFTWVPGYDFTNSPGEQKITFTADDGKLKETQDWTLIINNANQKPTILSIDGLKPINEGDTLTITVKGQDLDKQELNFSTQPDYFKAKGQAKLDKQTGITTLEMEWASPSDFVTPKNTPRIETVTMTGSDGVAGDETTKDFLVTVNNVNHAPEITVKPEPGDKIKENEKLTLTIEGSDKDGDTVVMSVTGASGFQLDSSSTNSKKIYTLTPDNDFVKDAPPASREINLSIKADDQNGLPNSVVTQPHTITVNDENRPPTVTPDPLNESVDEGQKWVIEPGGKINAIDPDGDPMTYDIAPKPEGLSIDANGVVTWTPNHEQGEAYVFTYSVTDEPKTGADAKTTTAKINVTVNDVNRPPVLDPIGNQVFKANDKINDLKFTANDPDKDNLFFKVIDLSKLPPGITMVTDSLTGTPTNDGTYDVTVEVRDRTIWVG